MENAPLHGNPSPRNCPAFIALTAKGSRRALVEENLHADAYASIRLRSAWASASSTCARVTPGNHSKYSSTRAPLSRFSNSEVTGTRVLPPRQRVRLLLQVFPLPLAVLRHHALNLGLRGGLGFGLALHEIRMRCEVLE